MQRDVICVCGVTGSGKTTWARLFADPVRRLFVYDLAASFRAQYAPVADIARVQSSGDLRNKNFRLGVYSPYDAEALTACAYMEGDCLLILEEISTLYKIGARDVGGPLQEAILLGRHRRVSILAIAQRITNIPIILRSQASRIISFRQQEPNDVAALREFLGRDALRLPSLPDLHCLDWNKGRVTDYTVPFPRTNSGQTVTTDTASASDTPAP